MTSGFNNSIVGGSGTLIRSAIHSPNYVAGVSGWSINKDGTCEFNSGTFRGTVVAGSFQGTNFVINNSGMFFYSGVPALGNLVMALAPTSGTDAFGNAYIGGLRIVGGALLDFPTKATHENITPKITSSIGVPHGGAQFTQFEIDGGNMNVVGARDRVLIQLNSADDDLTSTANMGFQYIDDAGAAHLWAYMDNTGFNIQQGSVPGGGSAFPVQGHYPPGVTFVARGSTIVPAADGNIAALPVVANAVYDFDAFYVITGAASGTPSNYRWNYTIPTGAEYELASTYLNSSNALNTNQYRQSAGADFIAWTNGVAAGNQFIVREKGTLYIGATITGGVTLMWAQGTSNGTTTRMWSGSRLVLTRIS
jgi:hypothetical protein